MQRPHTTPVAPRIRTMEIRSLAAEQLKIPLTKYRAQIREDMAHKAVAIDEKEFLDRFLGHPDDAPLGRLQPPRLLQNPFAALRNARTDLEKDVAAKMEAAINDHKLAPGLTFRLCQHVPDYVTIDPKAQKVDGAFFPSEYAPTDGGPQWAEQVVPWEFKRHETSVDPFDDKAEDIESNANTRKEVRGQIISYAEQVFAVQHRIHLLMILVIGRNVRLLRWDRSGVVVSKLVDYYVRWEFFCLVLWRMSLCHQFEPSALGADPTAIRIRSNMPEWKMMEDAAKRNDTDIDHTEGTPIADEVKGKIPITFEYVRKLFRESLRQEWPRYMLEVPDKNTVRKFLVARPYFRAPGMAGRGTRGYVALDCSNASLFRWLKDAWRGDYEALTPEGEVLEFLNQQNVHYIPTLVCHGDLEGQDTLTPDIWEKQNMAHGHSQSSSTSTDSSTSSSETDTEFNTQSSRSQKRKFVDDDEEPEPTCPLRRHRHYRIVVEEVGLNLASFETPKQLVAIVLMCMIAHYEAFKHDILHRDVSSGNILFLPRIERINGRMVVVWKGVLVDWEMSKRKSQSAEARQPERTGTWQFMSVALLNSLSKEVQVTDELEAYFYVILYHAVRYLESNIQDVGRWIETFFDSYSEQNGTLRCGHEKSTTVIGGQLLANFSSGDALKFNSPMDTLLATLLKCIRAHFIVQRYEVEPKHAEQAETEETNLPQLVLPELDDDEAVPPSDSYVDPQLDDILPFGMDEANQVETSVAIQKKPTDEDYSYAQRMKDHVYFLQVLRKFCAAQVHWPKAFAMDRISQDWVPIRAVYVPSKQSTHKKHKVHGAMTVPGVLALPDTPTKPRRVRRKP